MKVEITDKDEKGVSCDALILPVFDDEREPYREIDKELGRSIRGVVSSGEFKAKHLDTCIIHTMGRIRPERLLLMGLGGRRDCTDHRIRECGGKAASVSMEHGLKVLALSTGTLRRHGLSPVPFAEGVGLGGYRFTKYKEAGGGTEIEMLSILSAEERGLSESIEFVRRSTETVGLVRDLVNTPSNDLTPSGLAGFAEGLGSRRLKVKTLDSRDAAREGMGGFLSVSKGSKEEPRFVLLEYRGGRRGPVVLIGKSVTFDSGGISLKPSEGMEKMKYDMAGGAAVLGVMKFVSEMRLPLHLYGILPATENLPGGSAAKPGDVVRTVSGKTVEIISTDAEGRLTLADAIGYSRRFNPEAIIDIATLTGACSVALGNEAIAMMGNDKELMAMMQKASELSGERVWQMPLYDEYREYLKSDIADLKNSAGRTGSLVTAGYFLKEFAAGTPWVHLDIASTAWSDKDRPCVPKGASGAGVRLLINFLKEYIK